MKEKLLWTWLILGAIVGGLGCVQFGYGFVVGMGLQAIITVGMLFITEKSE